MCSLLFLGYSWSIFPFFLSVSLPSVASPGQRVWVLAGQNCADAKFVSNTLNASLLFLSPKEVQTLSFLLSDPCFAIQSVYSPFHLPLKTLCSSFKQSLLFLFRSEVDLKTEINTGSGAISHGFCGFSCWYISHHMEEKEDVYAI